MGLTINSIDPRDLKNQLTVEAQVAFVPEFAQHRRVLHFQVVRNSRPLCNIYVPEDEARQLARSFLDQLEKLRWKNLDSQSDG